MRIAVLGKKSLADRSCAIIRSEDSDVQLDKIYYERYVECVADVARLQKDYDGILFPGHLSYMFLESILPKECIWEYIPINTGSLYRALMELRTQGMDINNISIDTYGREFVLKAFNEVGIPEEQLDLYFADENWSDVEYDKHLIQYHKDNYYSRRAKCCMTGITEVWEQLVKDKIPCVRTIATDNVVLEAYNKLYIKIIQAGQTDYGIAALVIHCDASKLYTTTNSVEHLQLVTDYQTARKISMFASRVKGAVSREANGDFIIFTAQKDIEEETNNFNSTYLSTLLSNNDQIKVSVGIGIGMNAQQAKQNAYAGLGRSIQRKDSAAFIVYDNKKTRGPIKIAHVREEGSDSDFATELTNLGIGSANALKLANIVQESETNSFTVKELALKCGMSRRNMDRIINLLEDRGLCAVTGRRGNDGGGRPSRVVAFKEK